MKFFAILKKSIYGWIRDPLALFFTFAFPAISIIIFSITFKRGIYSPERNFEIVVVNHDTTSTLDKTSLYRIWIDFLKEAIYPSGRSLFEVKEVDSVGEDILKNLRRGKYSSVVEISSNFTKHIFRKSLRENLKEVSLLIGEKIRKGKIDFEKLRKNFKVFSYEKLGSDESDSSLVKIDGLQENLDFTIVTQVLKSTLNGFILSVTDSLLKEISSILNLDYRPSKPIPLIETFSLSPLKTTTFDYMVPRIMVFALMMMVSGISIGLIADFEFKQISLLRLIRMREIDCLGGEVTVALLIGII